MNFFRVVTASVVVLAFLAGTLSTAQAGSRLNEKNIIKKLIFKKKVRRTTTQRPGLRRKSERRTFKRVIRKRSEGLKDPVTFKRQRRKTRRKEKIQLNTGLTRAERRSRTRRKTLRRILNAKRLPVTTSGKRRTRRAKRRIAFPPPAIEIVDSGSSNTKQPGRVRPRKKAKDNRSTSNKWARTTPPRQHKTKKTVWRKSVTRPVKAYDDEPFDTYDTRAAKTVRVATTRLQRDQIKNIVESEGLPQVDIEIYFDYNSSSIRPHSMTDVGVLGRALRSEQLAGSQFMIIGHTDAKGSESYNLRLSEERAHAVRNFLVNVFGLDGARLFPMGYGEEQLKLTHRPHHAENRRVQVVNIGSGQQ